MADLRSASAAWERANDELEKAGEHAPEALRERERAAWHELLAVMDPFAIDDSSSPPEEARG